MTTCRYPHRGSLLFALALLLPPPAAWGATLVDRIVATVEGEIITQSEVDEAAKLLTGELRQAGGPLPPGEVLQKRALDDAIMRALLRQQSQRMGIKISEGDIDALFRTMASKNRLTPEQFTEEVKRQGIELSSYRQALHEQLVQMRLINQMIRPAVSVSDDEIREQVQGSNSPLPVAPATPAAPVEERVRLGHILIAIPDDSTPEEIERKRVLARDIAKRIEAGEGFATLAARHSDDTTRERGGEIGWFRRGETAKEIDAVAFTLDAGETSGPVRSARGWHILKVYEHQKPASRSFFADPKPVRNDPPPLNISPEEKERVRAQLLEQKIQARYRQWLRDLRLRAFVEQP
jgi:peptidyl-prolyl cis-trans isomerase SurA